MRALRTRAERRLRNARLAGHVRFRWRCFLGLLTYERGRALVQGYGAAATLALIGICPLPRGVPPGPMVWPVFAAWYCGREPSNGDHYLRA